MKHALTILAVGLICWCAAPSAAEDRIWVEAKINGKPTRLCFDSGASASALCPRTVQKLGLKFIPAPTNDFSHGVLAGDVEDCTLELEGAEGKASFLVLDLPAYVSADFDGLVGWWTIRRNVLRIDAAAREVSFLPHAPREVAPWAHLSLLTNSGSLDLQIPHDDGTNGVLCIDTGAAGGIALPGPAWRRWKEAHPNMPTTVETVFTPSDGFFVCEEAWADQIAVGPIILTGVPIAQAGPAGTDRWGAHYEGTLGLAALKRLDLVVDGNNGVAYWRPKKTRPPSYSHNRLGAVFVPTVAHTNQAVAWVVDGSPAFEAGVRNGDVLLRVDEVAVTGWSDAWLRLFYMPAGHKLKLTLERDGRIFKTTAILREILCPSPKNKR
jgi:hypothetical protein